MMNVIFIKSALYKSVNNQRDGVVLNAFPKEFIITTHKILPSMLTNLKSKQINLKKI